MAEINTQGIFSLGQHRSRSLDNRISSRTRESYSEYGYFSGGYVLRTFSRISTIFRFDHSNDTRGVSQRSGIPANVRDGTACSNLNFGYYCAGKLISSVYRIDYKSDITIATIRGSLAHSIGRWATSAGNSNFGYVLGGSDIPAAMASSSISRINYANDSNAAISRGNLNIPSYQGLSCGDINYCRNYGKFTATSLGTTTFNRSSYANDTNLVSFRGTLSRTDVGGGVGNSIYGWITYISFTQISRNDFSNDTSGFSSRGFISKLFAQYSGEGNSNFGWLGDVSFQSISTSNILRIDYSNDTIVTPTRSVFPTSSTSGRVAHSSSYFGGAPNTSNITTLPTQIQNNINYNLSNASTVPQKRALGSFGYFVGGTNGPTIFSTNTRIQFSNDSVVSTNRGPLSQNRWQHQTTGNSNFGYIAGGRVDIPSAIITTVDRVDYANDISGSIDRGPLSSASYYTRGCTSSSFAYFNQYTSISRLSYSDDSVTTVVRGNRVVGSNHYAISQNSNFAYYSGGGDIGGGNARSNIDRFQFSNDTSTTLNKGKLIFAKSESTAVGNNNFGYIGAARGVSPIQITFIERIDYSNDTNVASVRINLDTFRVANTGNSNFGYFSMGGRTAGDNIISSTDRLDYSNDVATTSRRGNSTVNYWFSRGLTNGRNS